MARRIVIGLVVLILVAAGGVLYDLCRWREARAGFGAVSVTMALRPLAGWHADWDRRLAIREGGGRLEVDLFEDTGWWRGSALYARGRSLLMLDDGQAGRMRFCLSPPRAVPESAGCDGARTEAQWGGAPPSRRHPGWRYLGMYEERRAPSGPVWRAWRDAAEPDLPDPL